MRKLFITLDAFALLIPGSSVRAQAAPSDASCQPVIAAVAAMVKTNRYHSTGTLTDEGKAYPMEEIYIGDTLYEMSPGSHWSRVAADPASRIHDMTSIVTLSGCHMAGTESVRGETATVYVGHSYTKMNDTHSEIKYWISTKSGLPLRVDEDAGPGETAMHISNLYSYGAGVHAPAGS